MTMDFPALFSAPRASLQLLDWGPPNEMQTGNKAEPSPGLFKRVRNPGPQNSNPRSQAGIPTGISQRIWSPRVWKAHSHMWTSFKSKWGRIRTRVVRRPIPLLGNIFAISWNSCLLLSRRGQQSSMKGLLSKPMGLLLPLSCCRRRREISGLKLAAVTISV